MDAECNEWRDVTIFVTNNISQCENISLLIYHFTAENVIIIKILFDLVFLWLIDTYKGLYLTHSAFTGMYFAFSMFLVSLSLVMTVLVLNMHFRTPEERKVPPWMHKIFLRFGKRFLLRQSENKIQPAGVRKTSNVRLQV